ncbi:HlyD family efflux transporter periplasmic adaptor subunit [Acaryochloris sp. IP29b_bin.137]|uniref:HlyD family efflux transporter periplasmic adaptor subunit n=1 Tax=Acaryochloris sp. IP29b_bin.137 TaxID=2969217 RepID=UPI0026243798|nr:HlyD family efflux transporter periplasmic adaptor subunit [Acaryochloris sp. IP29b_bin.137]
MGDKPFLKPSGKWIISGAVVLALGISGVSVFQALHPGPDKTENAPTPSAKQPRAISALGRIEPAGQVLKVSGPTGERVLRLLVKEGQQLEKGETLAFLDSYPERQAEVKLAASRLLEAQNRFIAEGELGRAQGQEARTRRNQAENPKIREILAQGALVRQSRVEYQQAQTNLKRYQNLQQAGAVSQQDLDDRMLSFRSKQQQLNNAIATLAMLEEELKTDSNNAKAQINRTQAGTLRSQAQIDLASAKSNLELAKARMTRTIIRAPKSGQVLKILVREGEAIPTIANQGSNAQQAILEMGNTRQMYVVAEVYETDINKVKIGQIAKINSPIIKGEIEGTVDKIGLKIGKNDVVGTDPAANTDLRVVEVKIRLHNSIAVAGLTNLTVNVDIQMEG